MSNIYKLIKINLEFLIQDFLNKILINIIILFYIYSLLELLKLLLNIICNSITFYVTNSETMPFIKTNFIINLLKYLL